MKCPNCKKEINLIPPAYRNLESYQIGTGKSVLATSSCCNSAFKVYIKTSFQLELYDGDKTKDDWGNSIKKYERTNK